MPKETNGITGQLFNADRDSGAWTSTPQLPSGGTFGIGATVIDETELGYLDSTVRGTANPSKALVPDTNNKMVGVRRVTAAKTADYTITAADSSKFFTNRGATGTVIFTVPTVTSAFDGVWFQVAAVVAAQVITISAQTAGQLIVFNDAAANTISLQTSGEIIGGGFYVYCDGTSWIVLAQVYEAQTVTITT
jgi:hypothetical protein